MFLTSGVPSLRSTLLAADIFFALPSWPVVGVGVAVGVGQLVGQGVGVGSGQVGSSVPFTVAGPMLVAFTNQSAHNTRTPSLGVNSTITDSPGSTQTAV